MAIFDKIQRYNLFDKEKQQHFGAYSNCLFDINFLSVENKNLKRENSTFFFAMDENFIISTSFIEQEKDCYFSFSAFEFISNSSLIFSKKIKNYDVFSSSNCLEKDISISEEGFEFSIDNNKNTSRIVLKCLDENGLEIKLDVSILTTDVSVVTNISKMSTENTFSLTQALKNLPVSGFAEFGSRKFMLSQAKNRLIIAENKTNKMKTNNHFLMVSMSEKENQLILIDKWKEDDINLPFIFFDGENTNQLPNFSIDFEQVKLLKDKPMRSDLNLKTRSNEQLLEFKNLSSSVAVYKKIFSKTTHHFISGKVNNFVAVGVFL